MTFKDILVHVDHRKSCAARVDLALNLANQHQARLTALYVAEERPVFSRNDSEAEAQLKATRQLFEEKTDAAGATAEWQLIDSRESGLGLIEAVNIHAHYHDLLILGQSDPASGNTTLYELSQRAVLGAGRPVLFAPYAGSFETVGRRILLAWRGGPESARALNDALPLLRRAREVQIVSVRSGSETEYGPDSSALLRHLAHHGIAAAAETVNPAGLSVGDMLLNRAADHGSDLLVMGAFSQTRRGIPGLGEVGRHLLKCMTIPVLMSH